MKPLTGRGVLWWVVGFFALIIAMNASFVILSIRTFRGEDEQKPYLQGVEYNETLARRAAQKKLGLRATVTGRRISPNTVRIAVALRRADGSPQTGLRLTGELRHPADENRDHPLRLKEVAAGHYEQDLTGVTRGTWDVLVATGRDGLPF